jgi:polyribonucleotide nucleotidyltransferase
VLAQALRQAKDARLEVLRVLHDAIPEPRSDVRERAPKIVSFEIPLDKIGEVIGPKGKVINAITLETGADISVNDDGVVGTVTIGSKDGSQVEEARRRIDLILDPPMAEIGGVYDGKVVNITKFGAFVNILPGRDGLLHISKLGGSRRIDRVEDVLNLGDEVEVRVSDIDNQGKLSLSLVDEGDDASGSPPRSDGGSGERQQGDGESGTPARSGQGGDQDRAPARARGRGGRGRDSVSFEQFWETQARDEFGDLGPADVGRPERRGGGGGGGRGGGRRRGGRGGGR